MGGGEAKGERRGGRMYVTKKTRNCRLIKSGAGAAAERGLPFRRDTVVHQTVGVTGRVESKGRKKKPLAHTCLNVFFPSAGFFGFLVFPASAVSVLFRSSSSTSMGAQKVRDSTQSDANGLKAWRWKRWTNPCKRASLTVLTAIRCILWAIRSWTSQLIDVKCYIMHSSGLSALNYTHVRETALDPLETVSFAFFSSSFWVFLLFSGKNFRS